MKYGLQFVDTPQNRMESAWRASKDRREIMSPTTVLREIYQGYVLALISLCDILSNIGASCRNLVTKTLQDARGII